MATDRDLQVEHWPESTRIDFPGRPIGKLRYAGLIPIGFGILFGWMPASQIARSLFRYMEGTGQPTDLVFSLFLLLFVMVALVPIGLGLMILIGRTRVVASPERIRITELAGPLRWSRRIRTTNIERLTLSTAPEKGAATVAFAGIGSLCAVMKDGKKLQIALGYPREWLNQAAGEILSQTNTRGTQILFNEETVTLDQSKPAPTIRPEKPDAPTGTNIIKNSGVSGVEFLVPSRGLNRESHGLFAIAVTWCVIVGTISGLAVISNLKRASWSGLLGSLGILSIFNGLGLTLLLTGVHLGTRKWSLRADSRELRIEMESPLRKKRWHWLRSHLKEVLVGDSGTKVNDKSLLQLQIFNLAGEKKGIMTGRDPVELEWVAWELNESLGLKPPEDEPTRSGGVPDFRAKVSSLGSSPSSE